MKSWTLHRSYHENARPRKEIGHRGTIPQYLCARHHGTGHQDGDTSDGTPKAFRRESDSTVRGRHSATEYERHRDDDQDDDSSDEERRRVYNEARIKELEAELGLMHQYP